MARKLFAGGLLLVVCLGLSLTGQVSSRGQPPDGVPPTDPNPQVDVRSPAPPPASIEQLAQELKNIRAQKAELARREKEVVGLLTKKIKEERQRLDRIESLLHGEDGKSKAVIIEKMEETSKRP